MFEANRKWNAAFLAASLLALASGASAQTVTLPTREVGGLRAIRARFRGHTGWFVLATERLHTAVSNGFEGNAPVEAENDQGLPSLDALDVRGLPESPMDAQGVFGVLGQDFFQGRRIEFDLERGSITVAPSSNSTQEGDVRLERTGDGVLGTRIEAAGRRVWALVATGKAEVLLSPEFAKAVPSAKVGEQVVHGISTGVSSATAVNLTEGLRSPLLGALWVAYRESLASETKGYAPPPDAFLPLVAFGASRVALDFGAATIHLTPRSRESRIGYFANDLLRRPLEFREGRLYLPAVSSPFPEKKDLEIVEIAGIDTPRIVRAIEGSRMLLADLTRKGLLGQKFVVLRDGVRVELTAEARPL